jgi:hypothetical protein
VCTVVAGVGWDMVVVMGRNSEVDFDSS